VPRIHLSRAPSEEIAGGSEDGVPGGTSGCWAGDTSRLQAILGSPAHGGGSVDELIEMIWAVPAISRL
jgi:hypothetical protein